VGPSFARHGRTVAIDLPGFGRSARSLRGTSLGVLNEALTRFVDAVSKDPVHLVGNSMGGALAILQSHARPERIASSLLVCPALPAPLGTPIAREWARTLVIATLPWGHVLLRREAAKVGPEGVVRALVDLCCVDASRVPRDVMDAHMALAAERAPLPWNELAFAEATRSLLGDVLFGKQIHRAIRQPGAPTLIIHGKGDRLVEVVASRAAVALNPRIELIELPDLGHVPQLEAPDTFMESASVWIERALALSASRDAASSHGRVASV
jgi:pimeloyl-ACP methyl ester carboxylesterase